MKKDTWTQDILKAEKKLLELKELHVKRFNAIQQGGGAGKFEY